jgi:hypothetical protein
MAKHSNVFLASAELAVIAVEQHGFMRGVNQYGKVSDQTLNIDRIEKYSNNEGGCASDSWTFALRLTLHFDSSDKGLACS